MSYNKKKLKINYHGGGKLPQRKKNKNPDPVSEMGFADFSPFRDYPYHIIDSSNIDMDRTGIPILANGVYLPPYSGQYQFDTDKVLEIPLAKAGGSISSEKAREMLKNPPHGKKLTEKQKRYFQALAHGWKPKKQSGGSKEKELFDKYYGQIEPWDRDPNTGQPLKGWDYFMYGDVPEMLSLQPQERSKLMRRMQNFLAQPTPITSSEEELFVRPIIETSDIYDVHRNIDPYKLRLNQDLTPKNPINAGSEYKSGGWLEKYQDGGNQVSDPRKIFHGIWRTTWLNDDGTIDTTRDTQEKMWPVQWKTNRKYKQEKIDCPECIKVFQEKGFIYVPQAKPNFGSDTPPTFRSFSAAGYPMIDVHTKKSSMVPDGYYEGSNREKNYRQKYQQGGGRPYNPLNFNELTLREIGDDYVRLYDKRKIHPVTGKSINPNKDLKTGDYSTDVIKTIRDEAKRAGIRNTDEIKKLLAVSLQESGLGATSGLEIGHVKMDIDPMIGLSETEWNNNYINNPMKQHARKMVLAWIHNTKKLNPGKKTLEQEFQYYNTPYPEKGQYNKFTEKAYHTDTGRNTNKFFGVDVSEKPLQASELPHGKTVKDLYQKVIYNNPEINFLLGSKPEYVTKRKLGGWLEKYQVAGSVSDADRVYDEYLKEQTAINEAIKDKDQFKKKPFEVASMFKTITPSKLPFVHEGCVGPWCATVATAQMAETYYDAPLPVTGGDTYMSSIWSGKHPNYSTTGKIYKNVAPGTMIQFMNPRYTKKGKLVPNSYESGHNMYVYGVKELGDGRKKLFVSQSPAGDYVIQSEYTIDKDNKIYRPDGSEISYANKIMAHRKQRWPSTTKRDSLANIIKTKYPALFGSEKYYGDFRPDYIGIRQIDGNDINIVPKYSDRSDNIDLEKSDIKAIIAQANDPAYKKRIMQEYNISNKEYNEVIKTMVGMYGVESQFNTEYLSKLKSWDIEENIKGHFEPKYSNMLIPEFVNMSRGPFQLNWKNLRSRTKNSAGRDTDERFESIWNPVKASDLAIKYLAENVPMLRKYAAKGRKNITKDNYLDFLGYIPNSQKLLRGRGDVVPKSRYAEQVDYYKNLIEVLPSSIETPVEIKKEGGWLDKYQTGNEVQAAVNLPAVDIVSDKTGTQYPYYKDLTNEEKKLFSSNSPIGAAIRTKAMTGKRSDVQGYADQLFKKGVYPALGGRLSAAPVVGAARVGSGAWNLMNGIFNSPAGKMAMIGWAADAVQRAPETISQFDKSNPMDYVNAGFDAATVYPVARGLRAASKVLPAANSSMLGIQGLNDITPQNLRKYLEPFTKQKGSFNKGIYHYMPDRNYVVKVEDPKFISHQIDNYDMFDLVDLYKNINKPNIASVKHQMPYNTSHRALFLNKVPGEHFNEIFPPIIDDIPRDSYKRLWDDLRYVQSEGFQPEFIGSNLLYDDAAKQFGLIDLSPPGAFRKNPSDMSWFETLSPNVIPGTKNYAEVMKKYLKDYLGDYYNAAYIKNFKNTNPSPNFAVSKISAVKKYQDRLDEYFKDSYKSGGQWLNKYL